MITDTSCVTAHRLTRCVQTDEQELKSELGQQSHVTT